MRRDARIRRITLGFLNCAEVPPQELTSIAAQAGFDSVGLRITGRRIGDPYTPVIGNAAAIADIRSRLAEHGTRLSNLSAYHLYPDVTLRELLPLLDTAYELGTETLLVSCYDPDQTRFCATVARYADAAAERGLRLAIEFVPFSQSKTLDDAVSMVREVGKPNFGIVVDPLHLARSGGRPEQLQSVPAEWFFFAQLCDAPREKPADVELQTEARMMRLDPGAGDLPMDEILDALPPNIELECEFPTVENLRLGPLQRAHSIRERALDYLSRYDARTREATVGQA